MNTRKRKEVVSNINNMRFSIFLIAIINFFAYSQVTDINGRIYQSTVINSNTWMSENLNVDKFNNGTIIYQAKSFKEWETYGSKKQPAWCYYNFDFRNEYMGKLYNWYVVSSEMEISPKGWHIPADWEWETLNGNKILSTFKSFGAYLSYGQFSQTPSSYSPDYYGPWHSNDTSTPYNLIIDVNGTFLLPQCALGCPSESGYLIRCIKNRSQ